MGPMDGLESLTSGKFQLFQHRDGRKLARQTSGIRLPATLAQHVDTFTGILGFPLDASPVVGATASGYVTPAIISKVYGISPGPKSSKNIQAIGQFQGQYV